MTNLHTLARRFPDEPRWIDLRGTLMAGRCDLFGDPDGEGFLVRSWDHAYAAVAGAPSPEAVLEAVDDPREEFEIFGFAADMERLRENFSGWEEEGITIHTLDEESASPRRKAVAVGFRIETRGFEGELDASFDLGGLPPKLAEEIGLAVEQKKPLAAALEGERPVAFCYAPFVTEGLWDVSIETLDGYRRKGLAAACFEAVRADLAGRGRAPVWGAHESNRASLALAAKLGFVPDSRLIGLIRR